VIQMLRPGLAALLLQILPYTMPVSAARAEADFDRTASALAPIPVSTTRPEGTVVRAQDDLESQIFLAPIKGGGLTLADLFASIEDHTPLVTAAQAARDGRQAALLVNQGAFDTRLTVDYFGRLTGGTDGSLGTSLVTKRLDTTGGVEVYGGYRISGGDFPVYEDEYFTNSRGELKGGFSVSLLRDRRTDAFRTGLANARLEVDAANQDYAFALVQIKSDAAAIYANWLYWTRNLEVYQNLLAIAENRQDALKRAVDAGQLPAIRLDENRQLILSRQADLLGAQQRVALMLREIGLYLRREDGQPDIPRYGSLSGFPDPFPYKTRPVDDWLQRILDQRPDIAAMRLEIAQAKNQLALADNDRQAKLDLKYELSRDFGASTSSTRVGTENVVALNFSLPLELRTARGKTLKAEAALKGIRADLQIITDQSGLALTANQKVLSATREQITVARDNVRLTRRLQQAEETRYLAGASNFFELNTQETALANSQLRFILAQRDHDLALVDFARLTGAIDLLALKAEVPH